MAVIIGHTEERLLYRAVVLVNCIPFHKRGLPLCIKGDALKGKNSLQEGGSEFFPSRASILIEKTLISTGDFT